MVFFKIDKKCHILLVIFKSRRRLLDNTCFFCEPFTNNNNNDNNDRGVPAHFDNFYEDQRCCLKLTCSSTWVPFSVAMTLLRRAGLSNPSPDLSLEAARDVGADGFCLQGEKFEKLKYGF